MVVKSGQWWSGVVKGGKESLRVVVGCQEWSIVINTVKDG